VVAGVQTSIRKRILLIPPLPGEKWKLIAGGDDDARIYTVIRSGVAIMKVKESGTASLIGASNRSAGLGASSINSVQPADIRGWSVGDNNTVVQSGFLKRINCGDQEMWDRYTCTGPGLFRFWNGPNAEANEYVEFGPLLENQVMQIRTDPRKRGVVDMTSIPPTPQHLNFWQQALADFLNFATGNNATPLAEEIKSQFGIVAPQGNPYSLMKGRFSVPIPAKSPGKPAEPYYIKVQIDDGSASSSIMASGTPLRRNPL
jgi:hypothetical protein